MKIEQCSYSLEKSWYFPKPLELTEDAQLVLCFASTTILKNPDIYDQIKSLYPKAHIIGCSTAGEICGTDVSDETLIVTAIHFEKTTLKVAKVPIADMKESFQAGEHLAQQLPHKDLVHVFVLSDGLNVNGSELVNGITKHLPVNVTVTGGLSGDGANFKKTYILSDGPARKNTLTLVGFYGDKLRIGYSSMGGWEKLGKEHTITRSEGNILYEMDGQPALELYKSYMGVDANDLPSSGLLYPLSLRMDENEEWVVRTILGVDEKQNSLTFAGDVPQGTQAHMMKANFERLIEGSHKAASITKKATTTPSPDLAILISCVGRKMVLKERTKEEVAAVRDVFGEKTALCGFYSYGEISPFTPNAKCELHNQTMTITTLREIIE